MNRTSKKIAVFLSLFLLFPALSVVSGEGYEALEGLKSIKAVFDFRDGNPGSALVHIKLVHQTYKDKAIRNLTDKPDFVVVFMGSAVKLLSKSKEAFSPDEKKMLDEMEQVISAMSKDGIKLEICMFAVDFFGVSPESLLPEMNRVDNGWISSAGYQAKGYPLVPVF
jgi:intracellular sulfur oxidation DsrE/DsrF family protein